MTNKQRLVVLAAVENEVRPNIGIIIIIVDLIAWSFAGCRDELTHRAARKSTVLLLRLQQQRPAADILHW
jgi:hypothetical protein